jgi:trans-aconitate 2-methyltransferase
MNHEKSINDWNPQLYLKFKNERTQPSIDLVSRISINDPENIIDIGCGPGNSTQILRYRWPESIITGLDNSPAMIEKAKSDFPDQKWISADTSTFDFKTKYQIVFSNAAIQWIPNHENLILKLLNTVENNGALAIQTPMFSDMPIGKSIDHVAKKTKWNEYTNGCNELFTFHDYIFYYDILAQNTERIDIWETSYIHVLDSHESILEWIQSAALKPYLDRLETDVLKNEFKKDILSEIKKDYPLQKNGKVLFSFKRLFFIAYK